MQKQFSGIEAIVDVYSTLHICLDDGIVLFVWPNLLEKNVMKCKYMIHVLILKGQSLELHNAYRLHQLIFIYRSFFVNGCNKTWEGIIVFVQF